MAEPPPAAGARRSVPRGFRRAADPAAAFLLVALVLGPALVLPGYTLRGDMVFVPEQPWKAAWLGLDGSVPRAVPMDALVSLLTQVVPGWLVQRVLLLAPLALGAVGVAKLLGQAPWFARLAAMTALVWNPWVAERLLIGQWAIVAGYAVLPWVVLAVAHRDDDPRARWGPAVLALAAAALCSPSSGVMAVLVALAVALGCRARRTAGVVGVAGLLVNLPWIVPSVLVPGGVSITGPSFSAFAARAESSLGLLPSVLGLGGIWKTSVVPAERTIVVVVLLTAVLGVLGLLGLLRADLRPDRGSGGLPPGARTGLVTVAVLGLLVAAVPGWAPVADALDSWAQRVPGLAMLRDGHRFLAPTALAVAVGIGETTARLGLVAGRPSGARRRAAALGVALLMTAPVLLLPGLAFGVGGALVPVRYPDEWHRVAAEVRDSGPGATVVLPWTGSYRGFAWNRYRAVLDPAPRFLPGEVLVDDRLLLGDPADPGSLVVPAESARQQAVGEALALGDAGLRADRLRQLGVRRVLLEKGNGAGPAVLPEGRTLHDGPGLRLVDLGAAAGRPAASSRNWVLGGMVLGGVTVVTAIGQVTQRYGYLVVSRRNRGGCTSRGPGEGPAL